MRSRMFSLALVSATLILATQFASAQSPYSYPWCSRQVARGSGTTSCYFTSYQQCMTTISGIGGYCYQSPYYHASSAARQPVATLRHRRHH
jgi:Protein of unknown function (DUF3551)